MHISPRYCAILLAMFFTFLFGTSSAFASSVKVSITGPTTAKVEVSGLSPDGGPYTASFEQTDQGANLSSGGAYSPVTMQPVGAGNPPVLEGSDAWPFNEIKSGDIITVTIRNHNGEVVGTGSVKKASSILSLALSILTLGLTEADQPTPKAPTQKKDPFEDKLVINDRKLVA